MRRRTGLLGSLTLLATSAVAVVATTSPPASAVYEERWCTTAPAPCIESFTIDGVPQTASSPVELIIDSTDHGDYREINFELSGDSADPGVDQVLRVVINTGTTFVPHRMFGTMGLQDVDRRQDGASNNLIEITGTPVRWTEGCTFVGLPSDWLCPDVATADYIRFGGDIAMLDDPTESTIGMYVGNNAYYNGIFFDEQPDGSHALSTDVAAPHHYADGTTVIVGSLRFRLSYRQMRLDMGIPNPETLVPGSLSGTINGGAGGGAFTTWHDPDGDGFFIEASGFTFSLKKIKVTAARINPTKPRITKTLRATSSRARVVHTYAKARGAKVTGYVARCATSGGHTVQATGPAGSTRVAVTGLRRGKAYHCRVAARSKAGPSAWSDRVRLAARP